MNARGARGKNLRLFSWVLRTAISMPVIAGYVALGAIVLAARTLAGIAGGTWRRASARVGRWDGEAETPTAA